MADENEHNFSLTPTGAHQYTTTTMSEPQLERLTSRWVLKMLPWVQARGGIYRVNRVATNNYQRIEFVKTGEPLEMSSNTLTALLMLRGFFDNEVLRELADKFQPQKYNAGEVIVSEKPPAKSPPKPAPLPPYPERRLYVIVTGTANVTKGGGSPQQVFGEGDHFGDEMLLDPPPSEWPFTVTANTAVSVLYLTYEDFTKFIETHRTLKAHIDLYTPPSAPPPYEIRPREYPLAMEQTVLSIPTRVADLYNEPTNQTQQQLKLVVERIREEQENRIINDPRFGLLNNIEPDQRLHARPQTPNDPTTPPRSYDLDRLVTSHRDPKFLLAHPRAIAAIGRRLSEQGVYAESLDFAGSRVPAWRGIPLLPCTKIPIKGDYTSILVLRTGEDKEGVIGLTQIGLPDEYEPGLNVRFMGVTGPSKNEKGEIESKISYLVSAYFSVAVLIPDALGVLDNVYVGPDEN